MDIFMGFINQKKTSLGAGIICIPKQRYFRLESCYNLPRWTCKALLKWVWVYLSILWSAFKVLFVWFIPSMFIPYIDEWVKRAGWEFSALLMRPVKFELPRPLRKKRAGFLHAGIGVELDPEKNTLTVRSWGASTGFSGVSGPNELFNDGMARGIGSQ